MGVSRSVGCALGLVLSGLTSQALACGYEDAAIVRLMAVSRPTIGQVAATGGPQNCEIYGTGFVVSRFGHVVTADHVVPESCRSFTFRREGDAEPIAMRVVVRSRWDAALLAPVEPPTSDQLFLPVLGGPLEDNEYRDQRVLIPSWFERHIENATFTTGRIMAVRLLQTPNRWEVCGAAANRGRSGSAVMTERGEVAAIYVERPGDNNEPVQDLAQVVPIRGDVYRELGLANLLFGDPNSVLNNPGQIFGGPNSVFNNPGQIFRGPNGTVTEIGRPARPVRVDPSSALPLEVSYSFQLSSTARPRQPPGSTTNRVIVRENGTIRDASSMNPLEIAFAMRFEDRDSVLRYGELFQREFRALEGYHFVPQGVHIRPSSHNPLRTALPDQQCADPGRNENCYRISADGKTLTLRYWLYAGTAVVDQAAGWLTADVVTLMRRDQ